MTSFIGMPVNAGVLADFLAMGLGTSVAAEALIEAGLRIHQLERTFNCQCGLTRRDDRVSKAYYGRLRPAGKLMPEISATEAELEKMKDDYYQIMGWDRDTNAPCAREVQIGGRSR